MLLRQVTCWLFGGFGFVAALGSPTIAQSLPTARPEDVGLSSAALARIAPRLRQLFVDSSYAPGFVIAVARHGKLAYLASVGLADIEHNVPMRSNTAFRIFSMTKPITTVAVLQLVERGQIRLADPVSKYIPAFSRMQVRRGTGAAATLADLTRPVTIEDLLTHTSGLSYSRTLLSRSPNIEYFADSIFTVPLLFQPGTAFTYSIALDVLGRVVEAASDKLLDRYFDEEILAPLGMHETSFHVMPSMTGRVAVDYTRGADGKLTAPAQLLASQFLPDSKSFRGGEGLMSTVTDYLRFTQMLLNRGEFGGRRILKAESVALMMSNHLPASYMAAVAAVSKGYLVGQYGFGYGGAVRVDSGGGAPESPGTFRWAGAHSTYFWVDPKADLAVLVWTQVSPNTVVFPEREVERLVYSAIIR
jgi:CubicO group peptidase (beta-lactamase class C family)